MVLQANQTDLMASDYARIEQALAFLHENYHRQPTLEEIAASISLSEYHFQRLFTRWVGISPKRFLQYLTKEHAKELLARSNDLLSVAYEAGLSGPGRLHDLFVNCEAVTPGEYKAQGAGLHIAYGFHMTPFGEALLGVTERGVCALNFLHSSGYRSHEQALERLQRSWQQAELIEDPDRTRPLVMRIFDASYRASGLPLSLFVKGTNFQIKVWEALLRIPPGSAVSYETIARAIGKPQALRAVGNAVASNPIQYIIPCHRVLRKMGEFGNYQGGTPRKMALLGWEAAQVAA
jgi:AraC family transcriptional regulator, regulatory protein of adaptative response / methylated-DNA-[protein]-cysteine methyltransferase